MTHMKSGVLTKNITLLLDEPKKKLNIEPRTVTNVSVITQNESADGDFNIGAGAGAHIIFPISPKKGNFNIEVGANAHITMTFLGNDSDNHDINFNFNLIGQGANVHFQMAAIYSQSSQSKIYCRLVHTARQTYGRIVSRRILLDNARSALKGMLKVEKAAQSTDTYLSDKVLLLGKKSEASSDPQLEILANDVKASHGATIGKISDEELFYLRSRGINIGTAESLLSMSFLQPALVGVPADLVRSLSLSGVLK